MVENNGDVPLQRLFTFLPVNLGPPLSIDLSDDIIMLYSQERGLRAPFLSNGEGGPTFKIVAEFFRAWNVHLLFNVLLLALIW